MFLLSCININRVLKGIITKDYKNNIILFNILYKSFVNAIFLGVIVICRTFIIQAIYILYKFLLLYFMKCMDVKLEDSVSLSAKL